MSLIEEGRGGSFATHEQRPRPLGCRHALSMETVERPSGAALLGDGRWERDVPRNVEYFGE